MANQNIKSLAASFAMDDCKLDDVLLDHCGLPHVISLAVHLDFFL